MADRVVAILRAPGTFAYRHPQFDPGVWAVQPGPDERYPWQVLHNGELHAQFERQARAERFAQFMRGERMAP